MNLRSRAPAEPSSRSISVCRFLAALLIALGLLGPVHPGQTQASASVFQASCTTLEPVTLPPSGVVPVVVSYMRNSRHMDDDVERKTVGNPRPGMVARILSRDRLRRGFESDGEFNRVWGPLGIRFALVGVRTCTYTLGSSQDLDRNNPRHDIPDPGANFAEVFLNVLEAVNTREVPTHAGTVAFRGLDLYLWWRIQGSTPGYGIRPRFGPMNEESGRGDEPSPGRPGAVWLDTKCVGGTDIAPRDTCAGLFSHEAGHFFGLCHCCLRSDVSASAQKCINFLKPNYCPGLRLSAVGGPACGGRLDKRLMSATNPFTDDDNFEVKACERDTALKGRDKVLRHGANGIGMRR